MAPARTLSDEELLRLAFEEYEELKRAVITRRPHHGIVDRLALRMRDVAGEIRRLMRRLGIAPRKREKRVTRSRDSQRTAANARHRQRAASAGQLACEACGWRRAIHCHHILPVADGGSDDPSNLILLCPNHHAIAHSLYRTDKAVAARVALLEALKRGE